MRFFSNENRESDQNDEQDSTVQLRNDEASDTTPAVPQQRTGSPWSAAPGDADTDTDSSDAELAAQERADGSDEPGYAGDHRDGDAVSHRDGDAVGHRDGDAGDHRDGDAVDLPLDDHSDNGSVATAPVDEENRVDEGETVEESSTTTTYGPDGTVTDASPDATDTDLAENEAVVETDVDDTTRGTTADTEPALKDDGDFDDPTAVDPATDRPLADGSASADSNSDSVPDDTELAADANTTDDDAVAAADDTGTAPVAEAPDETWNQTRDVSLDETPAAAAAPSDTTTTDGATVSDPTAPVVPIPVPVGDSGGTAAATETAPAAASAAPTGDKLPGSVAEPDLSSIFNPDDATSFHDRWRDVQLKFVDSPKEATTEAAGLLDEAVEKLAASLRDQKSRLHQVDSDDTEQLRVELRGYRDILDRVLGL